MNSTAEGNEFIHFDEYEDAVVGIELVGSQSADVQKRQMQWKWVIMAMQNAVQAAMVLALSGTDGCGALAPSLSKETERGCSTSAQTVRQGLWPSYDVLLERMGKPERMEGPVPDVSAEDHRNLQRLNELRRQFALQSHWLGD
jgi:hypothetical protein